MIAWSSQEARKLTSLRQLGRTLVALGIIALLAGTTARAQNLDQGKSGAKLFADSCTACHRSPRGLAKGRFKLTLYLFLKERTGCSRRDSLIKGYRLYVEHCERNQLEVVVSLTRAWTLVRFFEASLLQQTPCCRCKGIFVAHKHDPQSNFVCGACEPPSRAGKTKKAAIARIAEFERS